MGAFALNCNACVADPRAMIDLAGELRGRDADVLIEVAAEMDITWTQLSAHTSMQGLPWRPVSLRSREDFVQLLGNAQRLGGSRGLALMWGRRVGLHALGSFGLAVMSVATVGDASAYFLELHRVLQTPFRLEHEVVGDEVHMRTVYIPELRTLPEFGFHADCLAAICVAGLSAMLGRPARALRYVTPRPSCSDPPLYLSLLCDELVCQPETHSTLVYPASLMSEPVATRNRTLELEHRKVFEAALKGSEPQHSLGAQLRQILLNRLADPPSLAQASRVLGMSERSLRWHLQQASLTYRGLLRELRREQAERMLIEGKSVRHVCTALGYSDAANFRKAFRQWTDQAPSDWRGDRAAGGVSAG